MKLIVRLPFTKQATMLLGILINVVIFMSDMSDDQTPM